MGRHGIRPEQRVRKKIERMKLFFSAIYLFFFFFFFKTLSLTAAVSRQMHFPKINLLFFFSFSRSFFFTTCVTFFVWKTFDWGDKKKFPFYLASMWSGAEVATASTSSFVASAPTTAAATPARPSSTKSRRKLTSSSTSWVSVQFPQFLILYF